MPAGAMNSPANGSVEWTEWCWGANGQAPFGVISRRDRDAGRPPAPVPRPRRLGKLRLMLATRWPVRVHPVTGSDAAEAGDGPLLVAGGMASWR